MRVLHLSKFFPPVSGGIETVVRELADGLSRRGVDVRVLCANTLARTETETSKAGYVITRVAALGRLLSMSITPKLLGHVRREAATADVVHVHMPDPMSALALWVARPRGKIVVHWHSDVVRQRLALQVYRPLQDWLLRRADAIVATSQAYAQSSPWLRAWQHKTTVIPIGISDPVNEPQPGMADSIRQRFHGRDIVFSLGRMTYYKGFDVLIDAASDLREGCVIIVGGEGELLERYRDDVARRGLTHKICFVGHIPQQHLAAYFSAASVFCLASTQRSEAYGVVLLEAMAMGKPVVATEIAGSAVPWINQSGVTGLNVPVGDAGALAAAINRIAGDADYAQQLGRAARARFVQFLHEDTMVQRTHELYQHVLDSGDDSAQGQDTGTSS